jgi:peptide/nickel transport system permease protein
MEQFEKGKDPMIRYILQRLLIMIPILLAVAVLIFTLMYFVPGDPASIALGGGSATQMDIEAMREAMGLNRPYIIRLGEYLANLVFRFDFGNSYTYGSPVGAELLRRFPNTLKIALSSIILSVLIGVPLGVRAAVKANALEDRLSMFFSLLGNSMPGFWLALLLVLLFALELKWLPSSGSRTWRHFILPGLANSIGGVAGIARQTRSSMLEVIRSDYVTTARSKGLAEPSVIYGHALPNALIPIITICGGRFGFMLGGTMIIETIFAIPGIGSYLIDGVNSRDYNVVQGSIIYIALTFGIIMLITDIVYAYVDPRIKAQYVKKGRSSDA